MFVVTIQIRDIRFCDVPKIIGINPFEELKILSCEFPIPTSIWGFINYEFDDLQAQNSLKLTLGVRRGGKALA